MKGVVRPQPFVRYLRYFDEAAATIYHGFHTNGSELITGTHHYQLRLPVYTDDCFFFKFKKRALIRIGIMLFRKIA